MPLYTKKSSVIIVAIIDADIIVAASKEGDCWMVNSLQSGLRLDFKNKEYAYETRN